MHARARNLLRRLFPRGPLDVLRQVLLFAAAYYGYRLVRGAIDDPQGASIAFHNARELIGLERSIGLFIEPQTQTLFGSVQVLEDVASWIYINAQTTVTVGALVFVYLFHNERFYFVRNMFMVAMFIALVGYVTFPTAPPRFFPEWGFVDSVAGFTGVSHDNVSVNALFNPYAAVPSMHVCFALMIGIPLAKLARRRPVRLFWACYPALMTWVVVVTGNHWIADAVLGAATAGVSAYAAEWLARARPSVWAFSPAMATA